MLGHLRSQHGPDAGPNDDDYLTALHGEQPSSLANNAARVATTPVAEAAR